MQARYLKRWATGFWSVVFLFFGLAHSAHAARYHVMTGGQLTAGPSIPEDWSPANCYPDLVSGAAAVASAGDSLFLYNEDHSLDEQVTIPAFLGNMDGSSSYTECSIRNSPEGFFLIQAGSEPTIVRGLQLRGLGGGSSDQAIFQLEVSSEEFVTAFFEDCSFQNNKGSDLYGKGGSCILAKNSGAGGALTISRCRFEGNSCQGSGGAIFVEGGYEILVQESDFLENSSLLGTSGAEGRGGALYVSSPGNPSPVSLVDCSFDGNIAAGPGGAILVENASLSLVRTEVNDSQSAILEEATWAAGAGIMHRWTVAHTEPVSLVIDKCSFYRNQGLFGDYPWAADGGAVLVKGLSEDYLIDVTVSDSVFGENYNAQGGGLYIGRFSYGRVSRCRFLNNTTYLQGGASYKGGFSSENRGETARFEYCEFIGNRTGLDINGEDSGVMGRGGAFATRLYPRAEFIHCTFLDNLALGPSHLGDAFYQSQEGGYFAYDEERSDLINCVFFGNGGSVEVYSDDNGLGVVSHCAYEEGQLSCLGAEPVETVTLSGSPFLGPLDAHPAEGSPLIDTALDLFFEVDLEYNPVPSGAGPDIGAYEIDFGEAPVPLSPIPAIELSAWPNPFNPLIRFRYELFEPGPVLLEVFNLAGQRLAVLEQGEKGVGSHELIWRGEDATGRSLASGVFLARLKAGGNVTTRTLTLIR